MGVALPVRSVVNELSAEENKALGTDGAGPARGYVLHGDDQQAPQRPARCMPRHVWLAQLRQTTERLLALPPGLPLRTVPRRPPFPGSVPHWIQCYPHQGPRGQSSGGPSLPGLWLLWVPLAVGSGAAASSAPRVPST